MILIMGGNSGLGRKIISGFKKEQIIISVKTWRKVDESISFYPIRFADFDDKKSLEMAFSGIKILFFISGNTSSEKRIQQHNNVIEIAKEKGVEHVFYTSFIDVDPASPFLFSSSHEKTEFFIQESGLYYTILRNNLYSDFITRFTQNAMDCIGVPAGHGKIAFISREDIAIFAVKVLRILPRGYN